MPSAISRHGNVSPESIRAPTPTANDFPTPAGQMFHVTKRDQGLVSPAQSSFSFPDDEEPHAISNPRDYMEQKPIGRNIERGTPGDDAILSSSNGTPQQQELRKKKSQFYTEVFSYREPNLSPKERVYKDSVVTVEVKTNVIVSMLSPAAWNSAHCSQSRSKMNTNSCKISRRTSPNDSKGPPRPSSSY